MRSSIRYFAKKAMDEIVEISSKHEQLDKLRALSSKQGAVVRKLKSDGAQQAEITAAVSELKKLKLEVENEEKKYQEPLFDKEGLDSVLLRRMIVVPAFEIYGGEKGLFDLGTEGSFLMDNIVTTWRKHFVIRENMLQLSATCLTPHEVLQTSGHVDRFQDLMCKDLTTGSCFRADKLLEDHIQNLLEKPEIIADVEKREQLELIHRQADAYNPIELHEIIQKFGIKSPESGTVLSEPFPFNLMFGTSIGPEGTRRGYLRPETAQGIFVNFKRLLERKGGRMPFACAQVGLGFRNEISPRSGLVRVREFLMAEIEHFCDPEDKSYSRFDEVRNVRVTLFTKQNQLGNGKLISATVGAAVEQGIIANQTLGYFLARTHLFLAKIGINPEKLRFRQHLDTQMAHYACDCWDGEIKMSYGWVECVGLADRSCYDLKVHSEATNVALMASRHLKVPKTKIIAKVVANKGIIGKEFKKEASKLFEYFNDIENNDVHTALDIEKNLADHGKIDIVVDGKTYPLVRDMVKFKKSTVTIHTETYYPHVIEPSFGMGRIFYALLEHSFYSRTDETSTSGEVSRNVLKLRPCVAPIKVAVFPLQNGDAFLSKVRELTISLTDNLEVNIDSDTSSVSIGKRYARMDEIGTPFTVTVDQDALDGKGPTIRERDSTAQVRVPYEDLEKVLQSLIKEATTWQDVCELYSVL